MTFCLAFIIITACCSLANLSLTHKTYQLETTIIMGRFINLILAAAPLTVSGFSVPNGEVVSRRESFAKAASVIGGTIAAGGLVMPSAASATVTDETPIVTTRQGGLLEKYQDSRGWKIMAPSGWNGFDGEVGAYDKKWQDLVDPFDNIKLSSTPVKSTTTSM